MTGRIEQYAIVGDTQTAALVGGRRLDRLALRPAVRLRLVLRRPARRRRPTATGASGPPRAAAPPGGPYRDGTLVLETEWDTPEGTVRLVDCMPVRDQDVDVVRVVEGVRGAVPMTMELVVRFDYGDILPWVRAVDGSIRMVAGPARAVPHHARCTLEGKDFRHVAEFTVSEGEQIPFVLAGFPSYRHAARADRPARRRRPDHRGSGRSGPPARPTTATGATWCNAR